MAKYLFISVLLVTWLGQWELFVSVDGRFKVLAPGEMRLHVQEMETPIGDIDYHTYVHQADAEDTTAADNLVYMVSYCDYPEGAVHSDSTDLLEDFFDTTINTAINSVDGELVYLDEQTKRDYPGRIWRIDYKDGEASIKTKAFLIKQRFYVVQVVTLKDKRLNPLIDRFLDSFAVTDIE